MTTLAASTLALTNLTVDTLADTDEVRLARDVSGTAASRAATIAVLRSNVMKYGIWPRSSLEIAASVTPTDYGYPPGDVRRYGADPTGVADSSAAWIAACKSGHVVLGGGFYTYKFTSYVTLTTSARIDLQGATLKPTGATDLFRRYTSTTASTTISAGATVGSRDVTVASATGIAVGQWAKVHGSDYATSTVTMTLANPCVVTWAAHNLYAGCTVSFTTTGALAVTAGAIYYVISAGLTANTFRISLTPEGTAVDTSAGSQSGTHTAVAGNDADSYPVHWAKITDVSGTNVEFDRPLSVTYRRSITLATYAASTMLDAFEISNGTIDGTLSTSTIVGEAIRLAGYKKVRIGCDVANFINDNQNTYPVSITDCIDVAAIGHRSEGQTNRALTILAYHCRDFRVVGCDFDTDSFAIEAQCCESFIASGNTFRGRRNKAVDDSLTSHSVRGVKSFGCYAVTVVANHMYDFESPVKIQGGFRYIVSNNIIKNTTEITAGGSQAISIGGNIVGNNMLDGIVSNNIVDGNWGNGIAVTGDDLGGVLVSGNVVRNVKQYAFYSTGKNASFVNNRIVNWGLNNPTDSVAYEGIYHGGAGGNITGNRFAHSTLTSLPCIRNFFGNGYKWCIENNTSESGNPIGAVFQNAIAGQIASAATFTTITHGLSWTPTHSDITITFTSSSTTDPGNIWVDNIGSTTFRVNCRTAPGSDLPFRAGVSILMPVTA